MVSMSDRPLFSQGLFFDVLEHQKTQIQKEVQAINRDYLLNVSESDLCEHIVSKYELEPPVLKKDETYVENTSEVDVDVTGHLGFGRGLYRDEPA